MSKETQTDPLRGSVLVAFGRDHFFMFAELPDDTARGRIVSAVLEGLKTGEAPTVKNLAERLLAADLVNDAVKNAKSWVSHSHKGASGAPKGNDNARKTIENQSENNRKSINAAGIEKNRIEENRSEGVDGSPPSTSHAKRFTPPTVEEVAAYAREAGLRMDAARFVNYYTSNGWRVGRGPMKDWRAAARNWARRDGELGTAPASPAFPSQQRPMMPAARNDW